jgi:hypothetical protein
MSTIPLFRPIVSGWAGRLSAPGISVLAPNGLEADRFEPRAFESALVWMELKPGVVAPKPIAQHTVLLD